MKQLCNLAYAMLIENKTRAQVAELETLLAEPNRKDEMLARQNEMAMEGLGGQGFIPPPVHRPVDRPRRRSRPPAGNGN